MGKSKFGLGLVLGGLAGYYLTTDEGQKFLSKVKAEVASFQDDPESYQASIKSTVTDFAKDLASLYDHREELIGQFTETIEQFQDDFSEEVSTETGADVDDIVITYSE